MLIEAILSPLFLLLEVVISVIPSDFVPVSFDISGLISFLKMGFVVFPYEVFQLIIMNVLFWLELQIVWALVEWVYKKIPGVD